MGCSYTLPSNESASRRFGVRAGALFERALVVWVCGVARLVEGVFVLFLAWGR